MTTNISSLWLDTLPQDRIHTVIDKYPHVDGIYGLIVAILQADDVDSMIALRQVGYIPIIWSNVSKYIWSGTMGRVLGISSPVSGVPTCDPDEIGCMSLEEIMAMVTDDPSRVGDILDQAVREGLTDVIDSIVIEYGWHDVPVLGQSPMGILRSVPHDTMIWMDSHSIWNPPDLVHAIIYDQPEYLYDDMVDRDAIHAILMYDCLDMYNTYKGQVDRYVINNPEAILLTGGYGSRVMDILLRIPTVAKMVVSSDIPMTPEMADIVMGTQYIMGTLVRDSMVGILDKYVSIPDLMALSERSGIPSAVREYIDYIFQHV